MAFAGKGAGGSSLALPTPGTGAPAKPDPMLQPALANAAAQQGARPGSVFQDMSPAGSKGGPAAPAKKMNSTERIRQRQAARKGPVQADMPMEGAPSNLPVPTGGGGGYGPGMTGTTGSATGVTANPFKYAY